MSVAREEYQITYEIFVGSEKLFLLTVNDPDTGDALDLSSTSNYSTGNVKIVKPDGTIITTVSIGFSNRSNGVVSFTILDTITTNTNAGNWTGNLELLDDTGTIVEQQVFGFKILENY